MDAAPYNLAIETSSRAGSVTLGRGDDLLASIDLPEQQRHAVELLPCVDGLAREHGFTPDQIGQVFVSVGPGSFTGLRIAVTTAKMLARTVGCRLVEVPTLDVVVQNAPEDQPVVTVALNAKGGRCFIGVYDREADTWVGRGEPALWTPDQLLDAVDGEFALIGDHLPDHDWPARVALLDPALAQPRSEAVWRLGLEMANRGETVDWPAMTPMYVRLPDAEEKWQQNQAAAQE